MVYRNILKHQSMSPLIILVFVVISSVNGIPQQIFIPGLNIDPQQQQPQQPHYETQPPIPQTSQKLVTKTFSSSNINSNNINLNPHLISNSNNNNNNKINPNIDNNNNVLAFFTNSNNSNNNKNSNNKYEPTIPTFANKYVTSNRFGSVEKSDKNEKGSAKITIDRYQNSKELLENDYGKYKFFTNPIKFNNEFQIPQYTQPSYSNNKIEIPSFNGFFNQNNNLNNMNNNLNNINNLNNLNSHQISINTNNNQPSNNINSNRKQVEVSSIICIPGVNGKYADDKYCNMYHSCSSGVLQTYLCPENYLYSDTTKNCEQSRKVDCEKRLSLDFDHSNAPLFDSNNPFPYASPKIVNGSLECPLGSDGYYADPEFCNIYHHCLAGVDYADQCPHQLVWNDRKKMCDWQTNVNCTGKIIPVAYGQTSFCTDKVDNKYKDPEYCNVFHHCIGGIDNVVRCDGELMWNQEEVKCDWESKVQCNGKMLPSEKHYNSTFCINKPDGPYAHEEYCNVYHVCESGNDNIRQCPNQLFWDSKNKRCDWSGKVECTGRTLVTISTDTTLFCMERKDGVYGDPLWCNVYHNCLSGVDFRTKCPENLVWNETKKDCDWSDTTQCLTGNYYKDGTELEKLTFCTNKANGKYAHEQHCNRYYVCQNGKDIIFTCQNNLRYNDDKQECDWAVNVECGGKQDYMWEGIKDNFCKARPDGNYADPLYCNIFHQCQAAMDYPKRCSNRLMFNVNKGECDWEDQVDCRGKDKLIDTNGLEDESRPDQGGSNDGKGRVTKFCMVKENGNYADIYYCNVYHNCHGGFDTVQYCANGLVWRQDTNTTGTCDWPLSSKVANGVDCGPKQIFLIDKQSQIDIMAALRSDFCISRGEGLFAHLKYCDLYTQCTLQGVEITMECSAGLIFNEVKKECDYVPDDGIHLNSSACLPPKQILRPRPKADGTLMFNGNDVTGKFPTKFTCEQKVQQAMFGDDDWCNIYHVCAGPRDNIFICPPGTVFNRQKQGCFDRYSSQTCGGASYYKPNFKKLPNNFLTNTNFELYYK